MGRNVRFFYWKLCFVALIVTKFCTMVPEIKLLAPDSDHPWLFFLLIAGVVRETKLFWLWGGGHGDFSALGHQINQFCIKSSLHSSCCLNGQPLPLSSLSLPFTCLLSGLSGESTCWLEGTWGIPPLLPCDSCHKFHFLFFISFPNDYKSCRIASI